MGIVSTVDVDNADDSEDDEDNNENGKSFTSRESFQPTMFVPSKKKTKYKTG